MSYLPQEIIRRKRDGQRLTSEEIDFFISSIGSSGVADSQIAALAMAIFLNDMDLAETVALTSAMRDSGDILNWPDLGHDAGVPIVDKHSTGGIGDNVSLMLAPLAAACGLKVPMISGRGLGHTGGTLDKLEAIPGYNVSPSPELFKQAVHEVGCAIVSASQNFAPADKKIYAIRDITATVESVPLIVASILSKKLASGLEGLVLDVKCGNGATTSDPQEAEKLAQIMVDVANGAGLLTTALITDMNQPLADAVGNAVEVQNALDFLTGNKRGERQLDVILELAADMLVSGKISTNLSEAKSLAQNKLDDGSAAEKFAQMAHMLGGPSDIIDRPDKHLVKAPIIKPILASEGGWISSYEARELGMAVVAMGGGRSQPDDKIDYSVGLSQIKPIGSHVEKGSEIAIAHINSDEQYDQLLKKLSLIIDISSTQPKVSSPILARVTASK